MECFCLDGLIFKKMVCLGVQELYNNKQQINDLNVFPIPDGDTGDNMYMTLSGGFNSIIPETTTNLGTIISGFSEGSFLSARGNSGVIVSRIFNGLSSVLSTKEKASVDEFISALYNGIDVSYKAVSNPVEGTILTVFKQSVLRTVTKITEINIKDDFVEFFNILLSNMKDALSETTNQLEALKEAGVVDSGGAGLVAFFSGMRNALLSNDLDILPEDSVSNKKEVSTSNTLDFSKFTSDSELVYGYCTEFNLRILNSKVGDASLFDEDIIFNYLNKVGDSVVCFKSDSIIRVHVHTKTPGDILNYCQKFGEFLTLKIENMTLQHNESVFAIPKKQVKKKYAVVVVANGDGVCDKFKEMGVDYVINGGQSMNPPVKDFLDAYETLNAENILVFPSNSNIILTAKQSAELYKDSAVHVINNKDIGSSFIAIGCLDIDADVDYVLKHIKEVVKNTLTYSVAKADKNLITSDYKITKGDYICVKNKDIISFNKDKLSSVYELLSNVILEAYSLLLLIYGKDSNLDEVKKIKEQIRRENDELEIVEINGKQPIYDFILVFY